MTSAQTETQLYIYLDKPLDGPASVVGVNPDTLETTVLASIPVSEGEGIWTGFLSPAGEWIALAIGRTGSSALRLYNLDSGEVVSVIENFMFPRRPLTIASYFETFAWSPNGAYLAFHSATDQEGQTTYLYNLSTRTLTHLGMTNTNQYQLTWSPDSTRLALFSMECEMRGCVRAALDIFDAATSTLQRTIDLTAFAGNDGTEAVNFCQLHWSPNNIVISFVGTCDSSLLGAAREVQVVDIGHESITQATTLTPTDVAPANSLLTRPLTQYG